MPGPRCQPGVSHRHRGDTGGERRPVARELRDRSERARQAVRATLGPCELHAHGACRAGRGPSSGRRSRQSPRCLNWRSGCCGRRRERSRSGGGPGSSPRARRCTTALPSPTTCAWGGAQRKLGRGLARRRASGRPALTRGSERGGCPAASGRSSRSRSPSPSGPNCWCSTSPSRTSTRWPAATSLTPWPGRSPTRQRAPRWCSPPPGGRRGTGLGYLILLAGAQVRLAGPVDSLLAAHPRFQSLDDLVVSYLREVPR